MRWAGWEFPIQSGPTISLVDSVFDPSRSVSYEGFDNSIYCQDFMSLTVPAENSRLPCEKR